MATCTYRMHQKNASGTYDSVHLETESGVVVRPNGTTVEQKLVSCISATVVQDNVDGVQLDASSVNGLKFVVQSTDPGEGTAGEANTVVLVYE